LILHVSVLCRAKTSDSVVANISYLRSCKLSITFINTVKYTVYGNLFFLEYLLFMYTRGGYMTWAMKKIRLHLRIID